MPYPRHWVSPPRHTISEELRLQSSPRTEQDQVIRERGVAAWARSGQAPGGCASYDCGIPDDPRLCKALAALPGRLPGSWKLVARRRWSLLVRYHLFPHLYVFVLPEAYCPTCLFLFYCFSLCLSSSFVSPTPTPQTADWGGYRLSVEPKNLCWVVLFKKFIN